MAKIQEEVLEGFFKKLGESQSVDTTLIKELRALFKSGSKVKAQDLVAKYVEAKKKSVA